MNRAAFPSAVRGKVGALNGFRALSTLAAALAHEGIEEAEGGGMDEGRIFLHAAPGWRFHDGGGVELCSRSVGSAQDVRAAMSTLHRAKV